MAFLLGRISGYCPWWKIGVATASGILVGWFSPLFNLDGWFGDGTPVHLVYVVAMCGIVFSATSCVGLVYGVILRNGKAVLALAVSTSFISVLTLLLVVALFDQFGIHVGGAVPLAMSKVTIPV